MSKRIPFNQVDTAIYHSDQAPYLWNIHFEVRVEGRLDPSRLAAAALEAVRRHPMARARIRPFGRMTRTIHWWIDDEVAAVPLEIVDCTQDAEVQAVRVRLLNRRIDLQVGPPLALALAHHPKGDYLIMSLSHVVGDGVSAYRLMASICRAYTGSADPQPDLPLAQVRNLRGHVRRRNPADARTRLRAVARHLSDSRNDPPVSLAVDGGSGGAQGQGIHLLRFDRDEAERIAARRVKPATINDLLLAALAVTIRRFNDLRGVAPGRISLLMPVNLRPAEWRYELVSNIVSMVPVRVPECAQSDLAAAQAAVAKRTAELKEKRLAGVAVDIFGMLGILPAGARNAAVRWSHGLPADSAETGVLTNMGVVPPLDFGAGAGTTTEGWGSGPAGMPLGISVAIGSCNGQIFLTLRYCRGQFDAEGAAQFAADLRKVLLDEPSPGLFASADSGIPHRIPG
ncbi:condensation domain-containing protein [Mycobacterium decipiens]|nr:condensation domain-containing protein [Mycobacterium decipiens]